MNSVVNLVFIKLTMINIDVLCCYIVNEKRKKNLVIFFCTLFILWFVVRKNYMVINYDFLLVIYVLKMG